MRRISFIPGLLGMLLLQGCMGGNRYTYGYYSGRMRPITQTAYQAPPHRSDIHIVTKGETLYSIAFASGQDVRTVARWNHIYPPYTIYPNQKIRLSPPPQVFHSEQNKRISRIAPAPVTSTVDSSTDYRIKSKRFFSQKISWQWPTNGKIIGTFSANGIGQKGINIAGRIGQPVYAAASGVVVYCGDGLRGYGQLIILKHNDAFFSAYAHNSRLLVKENQRVNKGQQIADMGSTGADRPMLHFEVRRDGKPVNPLLYLPQRH